MDFANRFFKRRNKIRYLVFLILESFLRSYKYGIKCNHISQDSLTHAMFQITCDIQDS